MSGRPRILDVGPYAPRPRIIDMREFATQRVIAGDGGEVAARARSIAETLRAVSELQRSGRMSIRDLATLADAIEQAGAAELRGRASILAASQRIRDAIAAGGMESGAVSALLDSVRNTTPGGTDAGGLSSDIARWSGNGGDVLPGFAIAGNRTASWESAPSTSLADWTDSDDPWGLFPDRGGGPPGSSLVGRWGLVSDPVNEPRPDSAFRYNPGYLDRILKPAEALELYFGPRVDNPVRQETPNTPSEDGVPPPVPEPPPPPPPTDNDNDDVDPTATGKGSGWADRLGAALPGSWGSTTGSPNRVRVGPEPGSIGHGHRPKIRVSLNDEPMRRGDAAAGWRSPKHMLGEMWGGHGPRPMRQAGGLPAVKTRR